MRSLWLSLFRPRSTNDGLTPVRSLPPAFGLNRFEMFRPERERSAHAGDIECLGSEIHAREPRHMGRVGPARDQLPHAAPLARLLCASRLEQGRHPGVIHMWAVEASALISCRRTWPRGSRSTTRAACRVTTLVVIGEAPIWLSFWLSRPPKLAGMDENRTHPGRLNSAPQTVLKTVGLVSVTVRQRPLEFDLWLAHSVVDRRRPRLSSRLAVKLAVSGSRRPENS